jgi:hypothetical protein
MYYLLHDSRGVREFSRYLKNEFSHENLSFILACRILETKVTLKEFSLLAKKIFNDFIVTGSPFEINIVASIRNKLIAVLEPSIANGSDLLLENYNIYSDAVAHILTLLEKDSYKRYCRSLISKLPPGDRASRRIMLKSDSPALIHTSQTSSYQNLKSNSNSNLNSSDL